MKPTNENQRINGTLDTDPRSTIILVTALLAAVGASACDASTPAAASSSTKAVTRPAEAAASDTQIWQGKGTVFDRERKKLGDYQLKMTRQRQQDGRISSQVEVRLANGEVRRIRCTIDDSQDRESWAADCGEHGSGGGYCFGDGLCIDYQADKTGRARATTLIFDGEGQMRLLRTELENGKAVRFFRERLTRTDAQGAARQ